MPVVSIGLPVYNGEAFLAEALESLLAQSYADFELLISDNASTDETERICREFAERDSRIRYERSATNVGALVNFRRVLQRARGDYFMWAAADDRWSRDYVDSLLSAHRDSARAVLACGTTVYMDFEGNVGGGESKDLPPGLASSSGGRKAVVLALLDQHATAWIYGLFDRRQLVEHYRVALQQRVWGGDMVFLLYLSLHFEIVGVESAVIFKRQWKSSEYKPRGPADQVQWQSWYFVALLRQIWTSTSSFAEKSSLSREVVRYCYGLFYRRSPLRMLRLFHRAATEALGVRGD